MHTNIKINVCVCVLCVTEAVPVFLQCWFTPKGLRGGKGINEPRPVKACREICFRQHDWGKVRHMAVERDVRKLCPY